MRIFALVGAVIALIFAATTATAANVAFQEVRIPSPFAGEPPLNVGVWYPTAAPASDRRLGEFTQTVAAPNAAPSGHRHALVVISHGSGGWYGGHYDLALRLARAGFVVAGVTHFGDSYDDHTRTAQIQRRPAQLKALVDYMTTAWPQRRTIDVRRIGVYGFSAGGFTALVAAGGAPDLATVGPHCAAHPDVFDCNVLKQANIDPAAMRIPPSSEWIHDPRIKAAAVAAPALGFAFGREGLKDIHIPVQLWRAEFDHILPHPDYAEAVRIALPKAPEFHLVAGADHYDFLAPCPQRLAERISEICVSRPGFDRAQFHDAMNGEVVRFFRKTLR